jgi:hypothetical protein
VQRQGVVAAERGQLGMGQATLAHVVFGMDLEEPERRGGGADGGEVLGFEADTGLGGQGHVGARGWTGFRMGCGAGGGKGFGAETLRQGG